MVLLPLLSQTRKLTLLNAKCIYTCLLTKRELSSSPFMQCCVLYCVDQNHFQYHCTCITGYKCLNVCIPGVSALCMSTFITHWHLWCNNKQKGVFLPLPSTNHFSITMCCSTTYSFNLVVHQLIICSGITEVF